MSRSEPRGGVFSWSGIWVDSVRRISIVTYVAHTSMDGVGDRIRLRFHTMWCPLIRYGYVTYVRSFDPHIRSGRIDRTYRHTGDDQLCGDIVMSLHLRTMRMFSDPCRECIILFPENQIRYVRNKVNNRCLISDNSFLSIFSLIVLLY